ncbi:MAG: DAHL domain-containing protein [Cyanobacteria bacterium P01_D01_bin.105]
MNRLRSLKLKKSRLMLLGGIGLFIIVYGFLISQSLVSPTRQYQAYRKEIIALKALEANFDKEVLTSRHQLLTSYDGLVKNFADQQALQQQLSAVPRFVSAKDGQEITQILQERQVALSQKEELSEWFKSRNSLLKNSLRYLPLLTRQVESSFESVSASETANNTDSSRGAEVDAEAVNNRVSTAVSTELSSLTAAQQVTIRENLSQLIRNLLLYDASGEKQVAERAEALTQTLADLEDTLEIPEDELPTQVFRSHANVILSTKPLVEELTEQLLTPLGQHSQTLESTFERAYQKATRRVSLFRSMTLLWFLGFLGAVNYWYVKRYLKRSEYTDPAFERYRQQVATLATTAQQLNQRSEPDRQPSSSDLAPIALTPLTPIVEQENNLGVLARYLQKTGHQLNQQQSGHAADTFTFLTARLTLLTKHRQKLFTAKAASAVRTALETTLTNQACQLLNLQFAADQVSVQFSYPLSLSLEKLSQQIRQTAASALQPMAVAIDPAFQSAEDIWSEATLIASCESAAYDQAADSTTGQPASQTSHSQTNRQTTKAPLAVSQGEASA